MTWLSFCARQLGPEWKQGYGTGDRTLAQIEGVTDHSMEGSMAGAYSVLTGPRQSSWTFSIPKAGEPIQHYALEEITWHAGLPGDRRQDTSLIGNLTLVGKEHEGVAGELWTENQVYWSAKIDVALRALCPAFGANPPTLRKNMWEHRWLSATSCPSGRNPWHAKFALINEWEDDMTPEQQAQMDALKAEVGKLRRFQVAHTQFVRDKNTTAAFFIKDGKHHLINAEAWAAMELDDAQVLGLPHDEVIALAPERGPVVTVAEARLFANPHRRVEGSGVEHRHPHQHGEAG